MCPNIIRHALKRPCSRAPSEIAATLADGTVLIEFGRSASPKTRALLDAASAIDCYFKKVACEVASKGPGSTSTSMKKQLPT